jgi:tetratricopeptide (TPR) repeat protein
LVILAAAVLLISLGAQRALLEQTTWAQTSSPSTGPSSSSSSTPESRAVDTTPTGRIAQPEAGGSAITLENSEPLFYLAVALNACGYDAGVAESSPIRARVRGEINDELAGSAPARDARDALCTFIRLHALADPGRDIAQYVSLALYLSPPPELAPTVDETELPPDSTQVMGVLPLVRSFAEAVHMQALWAEHRPEYEGLIDRIHDPLTKMVLDTNVYLRLPISNYDGRRLLVLLEPMLAPTETNARIYANDYVVVVSPALQPSDSVRMDLVRHIYLQFLVEPLIYSRNSAMGRLQPLLKPVQQAPLEFTYKSDVAALLTECVIKAIEAQTMDVGIPRPEKPAFKDRSEQERYESEMIAYDRQAEVVRQKRVGLDMRQGWVLVDYFYNQLGMMQREGSSLKDKIGPMVYGMDVDRQVHQAGQIVFLPEGSGDSLVRRTPRQVTGLDLAEMKLMKGDVDGAEEMAVTALEMDAANAQAHYLLGRIDLMQHDPDGAVEHLTKTVQLSHDPRSIAWAHIYLGRIYDIEQPPERDKAIAEYKAALASRDSQPDTKDAAEKGIKEPFVGKGATGAPLRRDDSEELDPTGKAEKESYRPTAPQ